LKSLGKINSHYALKNYGVNAQPYYILKNAEGEMLVDPHGYDLEVANFVKFLQDGIAAYKAGK
jgi:thiol:disulfide interchange protein DsbD